VTLAVTPPRHSLAWVGPAPLWPTNGTATTATMRRPAILAFKSDQFVQELTDAVAAESLAAHVAAWESSRVPPAGMPRLGPKPYAPTPPQMATKPPQRQLKLFQPIHGRFYMVVASFVCQVPGLPDHTLKIANQERTYFVLRRLDTDGKTEMAWVPDPAFPGDPTKRTWKALGDQSGRPRLAVDEELNPLFPVFVPKTDRSPARRLHAGLIPTASRDTVTAPSSSGDATSAGDPRAFEASGRVVEPYGAIAKALTQLEANYPPASGDDSNVLPPPSVARATTAKDPSIDLIADASAFLMVDLAEILEKYVPDVFAAITQGGAAPAATTPSGVLYGKLASARADTVLGTTWATAIRSAASDAASAPDTTPSSLTASGFNLLNADATLIADPPDHSTPPAGDERYLSVLLSAAIAAQNAPFDPPDPTVATPILPKLGAGAIYVVRCVFQRCALKRDKLGVFFPSILSDPTTPFEIAAFFDTDAPARTIRIAMPIDTSPAALRKFPKSVGFLLSPKLQQQVCQVSDLAGILKGQLGGCSGVGEICCFSIPIISIIAMILMMMIAILLNFVFWWLPFLKICFPVPTAVLDAASEAEEA
jgi:hypothetical protein